MRHLIGRRNAGLATEGRFGVCGPRPCPRVAWGVAVSVLVHAIVIALTWHATPPRKPVKEAARMSVRLVARAPQPQVAAAPKAAPAPTVSARQSTTREPARTLKSVQPARVAKAAPRPAPLVATPLEPARTDAPAAPAETIDGSVFALPHIGIGGSATPRWMKPPATSATPPPSSLAPPPAMHAQAAREVGRAQIVLALQRHVSAWQAPDDAGDGSCALHTSPEGRIDCDSTALQQVVAPHATSLSGLLEAYRSLDPSASSVSIAYQQGRYRISLASALPAAQ